MKATKRIFAVALVVMLLALMIPSFGAVSNYTANITAKEGYTVSLYKIGSLNDNGTAYTAVSGVAAGIKTAVEASPVVPQTVLDAAEAAKKAGGNTGSKIGEQVAGATGVVTFTPTDAGLYYATITGTPAGTNVKKTGGSIFYLSSAKDASGAAMTTASVDISGKIEGYLLDEGNPHMMYDLLGWIKSQLISRFYIDATDECPDVKDLLALSDRIGAISAYAYLGDVGDSVTGDKKAQKFEDDFLDELVEYVAGLGYRAITYMPSRNTRAQLSRIRALCEKHGLFQISGEDINQPRQSFVCEAQRDPEFANLYEATWALIAHEWRATQDPGDGLFSARSIEKWPDLNERVKAFAAWGEGMER